MKRPQGATDWDQERLRTGNTRVSDDFDRLGDDALLSYLTDAVARSDMCLVIEQRCWDSRDCSATAADLKTISATKEMR
jgi:hypothetical protein